MRGHPRFRFYGVRPRDWRDGDDDGLVYELAFVREPDEAERETLGVAFECAIAGGPITALGPWRWNGRWARFAVMPTLPPDGAMWELARHVLWDRFFTAVEELTHTLCDVVPLAQVVFTNATAPSKGLAARWEAWSRARRVPDPSPSWRHADDDPAFEAARAAARARLSPMPWWESLLEGLATLS
jgi:hypothetical protein